MLPMFRTRQDALLPFVSESAKRFASVTGNKLRFAAMLRTQQDACFIAIPTPGQGGHGPPPGGLALRRKTEKSPRVGACSHPEGFSGFRAAPASPCDTQNCSSGTLFEYHANMVPQPWVQGTQYPGRGLGGRGVPQELTVLPGNRAGPGAGEADPPGACAGW